MAYFSFRSQNIFYEEKGDGPPLLLLHGNTASSMMFYEAAALYARDHKVILFDFLGHGRSERLPEFPADLWFDEALQAVAFLREKGYSGVDIIGSSGGALTAMNVALEAPELVGKVIADSFEGETPLKEFTRNVAEDRARSKQDEGAKMFYQYMHGDDWEQVVDNDTAAIIRHAAEIGKFFHKDLRGFKPDILMTGSREDEFISCVSPTFFEDTYGAMLEKIGHGSMHLFASGGHPAMLTNMAEFHALSLSFLRQ